MHDVGWIAIVGTVSMVFSILVVMGKLLVTYSTSSSTDGGLAGSGSAAAAPGGATTELVGSGGLPSMLVGFMDIVFTYGGQVSRGDDQVWLASACKMQNQPAHAPVQNGPRLACFSDAPARCACR